MSALATSHDSLLHDYLAESRQRAIDEIRRFVPKDSKHGPILYDLMLEYPLRDAKGLRPALCIAVCLALGGREEAVLPSAAVLELYHNAFLIHDDIEDGSERRRDLPTLHRKYGVPVAINVGDGMLALALVPLLENTRVVGLGKSLRILQLIATMARETAEGQAIELDWIRTGAWSLEDGAYCEMVVKKTAWYSFIAPMAIGAVVAGADEDIVDAVTRFATDLGIAFQIQDDVLNLRSRDEAAYGKEALGDLWEGKRTLILMHMLRVSSPADRARAVDILSRPRAIDGSRVTPDGRGAKTADDVDFLHRAILTSDSIEYAIAVGRRHAESARQALLSAESWLGPSVHRDVLHALVDFTVKRER